jgi:hypothetical protein
MFTIEEDYIVAAFLHPNYKQLRGATHSQMANCYTACRISLVPNTSSLLAPSEEEDEQTNKNGKRLMVTLMDKTKKRKLSSTDEVDRYNELLIEDGDQFQNPLDFWKQPIVVSKLISFRSKIFRYIMQLSGGRETV